ncbi:MAG: hypothetical protein R3Y27_06635 [Clostridia bacterium]
MESFLQYQPLFTDAINNDKIGVCKWIESGTTIDTALPELRNLTDDKKQWRAVVVQYVEDKQEVEFEAQPNNPYDFLINDRNHDLIEESPVPIIRLMHMLAGVPPLEVKFEAQVIKEPRKAPRTVYNAVKDEQREKNYEKLCDKYSFNGKRPHSVLIVTIRYKRERDRDMSISDVWLNPKESDSSEFWKRNHYPSICRFTVFDKYARGPVQKEMDDFRFWYTLMLMSTNKWDSSTLQAYRLYKIDAEMQLDEMQESFQNLANNLRDTKLSLQKRIKTELESRISDEEELPDYKFDITVPIKQPSGSEYRVKTKFFPLLSNGVNSELRTWHNQKEHAEKLLIAAIKSSERSLDKTADKMRGNCSFTQDEVQPLNKYQEEDILEEIQEIYNEIVRIQGNLPSKKYLSKENMAQAAQDVHEHLKGRVLKSPAQTAFGIISVLVFLTCIPSLVYHFLFDDGSIIAIAIALATFLGFVAGFGLIVLLIQKMQTDLVIRSYNYQLDILFGKLVDKAGEYSLYMSNISSHSRGYSYLRHSDFMKDENNNNQSDKYIHIKAINILLNKLKIWSRVFKLDVDFSRPRTEKSIEIDTSIFPAQNKKYSLFTGKTFEVDVNNSGLTMQAPSKFASKIKIEREELYDDRLS